MAYEKIERPENDYRIVCGKEYIVYRQEFGGKVFYKIEVGKDKSGNRVYKNVAFTSDTKNTNLPNGTLIRPLALYESFFFRKDDKYNPVFTVGFTDWEVVENETSAENEYKQSLNVADMDFSDDIPF